MIQKPEIKSRKSRLGRRPLFIPKPFLLVPSARAIQSSRCLCGLLFYNQDIMHTTD